MVSKLRLCKLTQSARASASATVVIASTSTASYSPKIRVDVIGSNPSDSPNGFVRSPTMVFRGAVKTFTLSPFDVAGAVSPGVSFSPFVLSIGVHPFDVRVSMSERVTEGSPPKALARLLRGTHEIAPRCLAEGDAVELRRRLDVRKGQLAVIIRNIEHLIKSRDGIANVAGVRQRLLSLLRKGVDAIGEITPPGEPAVLLMGFPGRFHFASSFR